MDAAYLPAPACALAQHRPVAIVGFYILLQIGIVLWVDSTVYPGILTPPPISDASQMSSAHSVVKLMREAGR